MGRFRGSVVIGAAVVVMGLVGCGGATASDAKAQERGKAACELLVALDLRTSSVRFLRDTDKTKAADEGWVYSGVLEATPASSEATFYAYACVANKDGKIVDKDLRKG